MKKSRLLFLKFRFASGLSLLLFLINNYSNAQISTHENPTSFSPLIQSKEKMLSQNKIQLIQLQDIDSAKLAKEDLERDKMNLPFRFGFTFPVNINLSNAGNWDNLTNGTRVWRLRIRTATNARATGLIYNKFYIPKGT